MIKVNKFYQNEWSIYKIIIVICIATYVFCIAISEQHHRARYHPGSGHDSGQFYYARILISDTKAALQEPNFAAVLESKLKAHEFITEGIPGIILMKAMLAFFTLHDLSDTPLNDAGDNFLAFRIEYGLYVLFAAITAFAIHGFVSLIAGQRAGYLSAITYLLSGETAFFIMGWKVYPVPSVMFMLLMVYSFAKSLSPEIQNTGRSVWCMAFAGIWGGIMIMCNVKLAYVVPLLGAASFFLYVTSSRESRHGYILKRWGAMIACTLAPPLLYDAVVWGTFTDPYVKLQLPWGVRSWGFVADLLLFKDTYSSKDAVYTKFLEQYGYIHWPTFYFDLIRTLEGWPIMVFGIAGMIWAGRILFQRLPPANDTPGYLAHFGAFFLVGLGVISPLLQTVALRISGNESIFATGRTFYSFLVGFHMLAGIAMAMLLKNCRPALRQAVVVGLVFCCSWQLWGVVRMTSVLNAPDKGFWALPNTIMEFPDKSFSKYSLFAK